jgi:ribose transport system permease protein
VESGVHAASGAIPKDVNVTVTDVAHKDVVAKPADGKESRRRPLTNLARFTLLVVVVLEYLVFAAFRPEAFFNLNTITTIVSVQAPLLILTLGMTLVLVIGEFDLSVGATLVMANVMVAALSANYGVPILLAAVIALVTGLVIGLLNALLVVRIGLNSFIATLGTATLLTGFAAALAGSTIVSNVPEVLTDIAGTRVFRLPLVVYYALVLAVVLWYLYEYTPLGRYLQFVGGNTEVARLAGVRTNRVKTLAFVGTALIAAFAGLMQAGTLGSADPSAGPSFLLPAFAAAFLGATAIKVGRFNVWGTVIASYLLVTGVTGLSLLGLTGWVQDAFNGGALLTALVAARLTRSER